MMQHLDACQCETYTLMKLTEQYQPYRPDICRWQVTPITARQQQVLDYLVEHITAWGFAPSHRDISNHFGLRSTRSAALHLRELEAKGAIEIKRGIARGPGTGSPHRYPASSVVATQSEAW